MSILVIEASPDLLRLRNEGFGVRIRSDHLVIEPVPVLTDSGEVVMGSLVKPIEILPDGKATWGGDHTIFMAGPTPCDSKGRPLSQILNNSEAKQLAGGLAINHYLSWKQKSRKPPYDDLHHLVTTYVALISGPAETVDPSKQARCFPVVEDIDEETPFLYADTSSTRAGIRAIAEKLDNQRIGIIGLGGTGSYVLDFVGKTRVAEIHLYDKDPFEPHSAFRAPGAAGLDTLRAAPSKVDYLADEYSRMKRNIVPHCIFIEPNNMEQLAGLDFVFLCIDRPERKAPIMDYLMAAKIPFIDAGMGIHEVDGSLDGTICTTNVFGEERQKARALISTKEAPDGGEYNSNIQLAEANALNAALAVMEWKKHVGFYAGSPGMRRSLFVIGPPMFAKVMDEEDDDAGSA